MSRISTGDERPGRLTFSFFVSLLLPVRFCPSDLSLSLCLSLSVCLPVALRPSLFLSFVGFVDEKVPPKSLHSGDAAEKKGGEMNVK